MTTLRLLLLLCCGAALLAFVLYPLPLADKLAAIPYGLDPQRPSHTYIAGEIPMPLEARKTGMFAGFFLTYLFLIARGRGRAADFPSLRLIIVLIACFAVMALDGLNATFYDLGWPHLYTPDLRQRLATGLLAGLSMAAVLLPAVNGVLWRDIAAKPSIAGIGELLSALALLACMFVLVDARTPLVSSLLGAFSVAGLVVELALINLVLVLAVSDRMGRAQGGWDALPAVVAGLCLAACELALMAVVRHVFLDDITRLM